MNDLMYEDELPRDISTALYDAWYNQSKLVDGVRMGPRWSEFYKAMTNPESPKSDTPEVDEFVKEMHELGLTTFPPGNEFARSLERRLNDAVRELETLVRESQKVADDHHRPRYTRLDEALESARKYIESTKRK